MYFCNAPIFCSVPMHYEEMSLLSGVMHNKVLHSFVVHGHIMKKYITKICDTQHKSYVIFRQEIVFNNFLNLL